MDLLTAYNLINAVLEGEAPVDHEHLPDALVTLSVESIMTGVGLERREAEDLVKMGYGLVIMHDDEGNIAVGLDLPELGIWTQEEKP